MMEAKELAQLGVEMRSAQREYFRTRTSGALERSKVLERRFDQALQEVLMVQRNLFTEQEGQVR